MKQINWGIIGLGSIAYRFAESFKFLDKAKLLGIASRDSNKLKKFQEDFKIDNNYCFNNYENLLKSNNIDIIYIALPTSFHYEWISKCLEKGKKVLVEKPGLNGKVVELKSKNPDLTKLSTVNSSENTNFAVTVVKIPSSPKPNSSKQISGWFKDMDVKSLEEGYLGPAWMK